ncbi:unnamed protein product [Symbiodinium sp. CCMP2456]|nr:unnamed protein product [Symbiodinium sp. CCMP2456]
MKACAPVLLPERSCRANSPTKARVLHGQSSVNFLSPTSFVTLPLYCVAAQAWHHHRRRSCRSRASIRDGVLAALQADDNDDESSSRNTRGSKNNKGKQKAARRAAEDQDIHNTDGLLMLATAILQRRDRVMMFRDFELLCMSNDLEAEDVLSKCEFLVREDSGIVDTVEVQSFDDVLVFCLVEKFGSDGGSSSSMLLSQLGEYASELLPKRERETQGIGRMLALHADKFCVSGDRVTIRQRPTWPEPSFEDAVPTSLSKLSAGVEREGSADSSTVTADTFAGRLRKSVPDITEALLKQPVLFRGSLGKTSAESDTKKLASAFEKCIEQYGFLMLGSRCTPIS